MIIRGGENIYPKEIEDFLNTHAYILETQVSKKYLASLCDSIDVCVP